MLSSIPEPTMATGDNIIEETVRNNQEAWVPAPIPPLTNLSNAIWFPYLDNTIPGLEELCGPLLWEQQISYPGIHGPS